jgi:hypothetical protein
MPPFGQIIDGLRSLSFGGLLGAGIAGIIYLSSPLLRATGVTLYEMFLVGGLLGGGFHEAINRWIIRTFLGPWARSARHYIRVAEVLGWLRMGWITPPRAAQLINQLADSYFLGDLEKTSMPKLPAPSRRRKLTAGDEMDTR